MKRISLLLVAATMISALTFVGCQKEVANTSANRNPTMLTDQPLTWTVNPSPAIAGQPVTVCAPITCGKAKILLSTDGGPYVEVTDFLQAGSVCYTFTPDAASCSGTPKYRFGLQFVPGGGGVDLNCQGGGFNANSFNNTGLFCFATAEETCTDETALTINGVAQVLSSANGWSTIKVTYTVTACKEVLGVKTQGGATAGGNVGATEPIDVTAGAEVKELNSNYVLSWTDDFAAGQSRSYTFTYTRAFTACGNVTGNWSSKSANGLSEASITSLQGCPLP